MRNLPMSREEFKEEFTLLFNSLATDFFNKVFGVKSESKPINNSEVMNIKEVVDFIGVSRVTLNNWIISNKIISIKKGNRRFFNRAYIEKFKMANFNFNERLPKHPTTFL